MPGLEASCPGQCPWRLPGPDHWWGSLSKPLLPQVSLLEELLSPLLTPLFLLFWFRPRALEIIDFFHHFTVDVAGVGDICSFALMDVKRHGHPQVRALFWPCGVVLSRSLLASPKADLGFNPAPLLDACDLEQISSFPGALVSSSGEGKESKQCVDALG